VTVLIEHLVTENVELHEGVAAESAAVDEGVTVSLRDGRKLHAEMAFVAIGRRPDVGDLALDRSGLSVGRNQGIAVDQHCRSRVAHIYAAGDVTGTPMSANKAMAQGWTAGQHAAGRTDALYRPQTITEAVYTEPQIAQVGLPEPKSERTDTPLHIFKVAQDSVLKALLLDDPHGFVKLMVHAKSGRVLGASAVGAHAADVLGPIALGIGLNVDLEDLRALFAAHPTWSELPFAAVRRQQPK
jgi:dihydrolipoamide dehydrogenase